MSFVRFEEANAWLPFDCSDEEYAERYAENRLKAQAWAAWANAWERVEGRSKAPYDPSYPTRSVIA